MTPDPTIQASFDATEDAATFTDNDELLEPLVDPCDVCGAPAYVVADNHPRCHEHDDA